MFSEPPLPLLRFGGRRGGGSFFTVFRQQFQIIGKIDVKAGFGVAFNQAEIIGMFKKNLTQMRIFRHQIRRRIKVAAPQNRIVFVSAVRGDQKLAFFAFVERLYHPVKVFGRNVRHVGRDQQRAVAGGGHRFQRF